MARVRSVWLVLAALTVSAGEVVPGRYIIQLTESPSRDSPDSPARRQQAGVRRTLEQRRIRIGGALHHVASALLVEMPAAEIARVRAIPGVKRVQPVELLDLYLDHATALSAVPAAHAQIGGSPNAGRGVRIAILDTGIDISHRAFREDGLKAPDGFPQLSSEVNRRLTNGRVIVARAYDPANPSAEDRHGHGTAVAMAAAGALVDGPRGPLMGVAPGAWIGVYRVNLGDSGSIPSDWALRALDDAVADGMEVINISFGQVGYARPSANVLYDAIAAARARGVVVVAAAGNQGPDSMSVDWTASIPEVLSVGASDSDRMALTPALLVDGGPTLAAVPGSNTFSIRPLQGTLFDTGRLDPSGTACLPLPPESLVGFIALVQAGECSPEEKLNHLERAGATAAVIIAASSSPVVAEWSAGGATLPGWMIANLDGQRLRNLVISDDTLQVTLRAWEMPLDPNVVTIFSGRGPTVEFLVKPDLVAVGHRFTTATQIVNRAGALYNPSGFVTTQGTSFSAPIAAGAAAVLKSARAGLAEDEYRSLLVNTATYIPEPILRSGAGRLDLARALRSTVTALPVSLSFGLASSSNEALRDFRLKNHSPYWETFTVTVETGDEVRPRLPQSYFVVAPGDSVAVNVLLETTRLLAGTYQGDLAVESTGSPEPIRVPYWFAVADGTPARISLPGAPTSGPAGTLLPIRFRVQDAVGLPVDRPIPTGTVEAGTGKVLGVTLDPDFPGTWIATVELDPVPGRNVFRVISGNASAQISIQGVRP